MHGFMNVKFTKYVSTKPAFRSRFEPGTFQIQSRSVMFGCITTNGTARVSSKCQVRMVDQVDVST